MTPVLSSKIVIANTFNARPLNITLKPSDNENCLYKGGHPLAPLLIPPDTLQIPPRLPKKKTNMKTYRTLGHRNVDSSDLHNPARPNFTQHWTLVGSVGRRRKDVYRKDFRRRNHKEQKCAETEQQSESTHLGRWVRFAFLGREVDRII